MTQIVGVVNITPDSFSDGQKFLDKDHALKQVKTLIDDGANVIEVGAESTRPNATPITHEEEWQRLEPVLPDVIEYCKNAEIDVSLDSYHAENVRKALEMGADWINDVTGFTNFDMIEAVKDADCRCVIMHNLGVPTEPSIVIPEEQDVIEIIFSWAEYSIDGLEKNNIRRDRIIFDPGIGFGKTAEQSFEIIRAIEQFRSLGVPLLVGHSRKSFIKKLVEKTTPNRDTETAIISAYLANHFIDYIRVHNVLDNKAAIDLALELS
ncbi:MAG: dihydropteroate synthase [Rickettsiales bacterium]|nr:dihydropteroate synthase [Rickettsiales bacterium]